MLFHTVRAVQPNIIQSVKITTVTQGFKSNSEHSVDLPVSQTIMCDATLF